MGSSEFGDSTFDSPIWPAVKLVYAGHLFGATGRFVLTYYVEEYWNKNISAGRVPMHVSHIDVENFRCFGGRDAHRHLSLDLNPGLNVLVGENDAGKSTIVDALRLVLWTTAQEFFRLSDDDFYVQGAARVEIFTIVVTLDGLNVAQQARFLELLTVEEGQNPKLIIHYQASRSLIGGPGGRPRYPVIVRTGRDGQGPTIEGPARELIRATYLRPLRDAEAEMTAGRGSRLSQVLRNHPDAQDQAANDYAPGGGAEPTRRSWGYSKKRSPQVSGNPFIQQVQQDISDDFLACPIVGCRSVDCINRCWLGAPNCSTSWRN